MEDKWWVNKVEINCKMVERKYEISLPYRDTSIKLHNTKEVAQRRVKVCRRKLLREDDFRKSYFDFMEEMLSKNFAKVIPVILFFFMVEVRKDDVKDSRAITPNMLLTMECCPVALDGIEEENCLRKRWKQVQHLAEQFWIMWKKEYLTTLQTRQKWKKEKRNV